MLIRGEFNKYLLRFYSRLAVEQPNHQETFDLYLTHYLVNEQNQGLAKLPARFAE